MQRIRLAGLALASMIPLVAASAASAQTVFGNFEDGTTDGFGYLSSSSGVQPFPASPGPTVAVVVPSSGPDTTHVLDITASGYNGGQSGGNDLGYDFAANGLTSTFLADDVISFQWEVAPGETFPGGYAQLYNIVLNAPGGGYTTVGGSSGSTSPLAVTTGTVQAGSAGTLYTVSIDYDAYKAAILADTTTPGYIQLGITTNNGSGNLDYYFDNFTLSTAPAVPEPASLSLLGLGVAGMLIRRRR